MDLTPGPESKIRSEAIAAAACKLAIHPVLALLALQDDGAPEAEDQIRDCATNIVDAILPAAYRAGREDAAREERAKVAEEIAEAVSTCFDPFGSIDSAIAYNHAAHVAWMRRVPDCGHEYHGADGGPCPRCGFDVADQANQPRTPLADVSGDTESSPEVER